jgi:hypothetical protein
LSKLKNLINITIVNNKSIKKCSPSKRWFASPAFSPLSSPPRSHFPSKKRKKLFLKILTIDAQQLGIRVCGGGGWGGHWGFSQILLRGYLGLPENLGAGSFFVFYFIL